MILSFCCAGLASYAQETQGTKTMEIYGFMMTDAGYNTGRIHPDWFDVMRPTKLPTEEGQYGSDGNFFFSVRQSRFGVKNYFQTPLGELKTHFEFEFFGTGVDAGQTTIRLRHAYGELGKFGAGQYWSPFMDIDIFPNTVEYWGPSGMAFFRNVQVRYMPIQGETRMTIALERPGASADQGSYGDRITGAQISPRFSVPDLSAEFRKTFKSGSYVEIAGIARSMALESGVSDTIDQSLLGWGLNLTTNLKFGSKTTFRGGVVYGEGIQNYMNDAPVDVAVDVQDDGTLEAAVVPMVSFSAFIDHNWNERFSTSIGYSMIDIDNTNGQSYDAFSKGDYAIANLAYYPTKNMMAVVELQYGARENKEVLDENDPSYDVYLPDYDAVRVQFTFKYNFSQSFYARSGN